MIPKFRAWDKIDKVMREVSIMEWLNPEFNDAPFIVGFKICFRHTNVPYEPDEIEEDILWRKASEVEPMQFTGLHDKDGKEIYESDIVQYFDKKTGIPEDDKPGIINYSTTKAVWCIGDFNLGETIMYCGVENIKIIGNIYENPRLLSEVE